MRKLVVSFVILATIFCLTACSGIILEDEVRFQGDPDGNVYVHVNGMEAYNDLLSKAKIGDTFIPYEKVKMLGDFSDVRAIVYLSMSKTGETLKEVKLDSNGVIYWFTGESRIALRISKPTAENPAEDGPFVTDIPNKHDLRDFHSSTEKPCTYRVGEISYWYFLDGLNTITWRSKYHVYTIMLDYGVQYDNEFLLRLFDADTAENAVKEFNDEIEDMIVQRKIRRYCYPLILAVLIITTTILSYLLICRRKKKKKAAVAVTLISEETQTE